jgi:hypothetical protein
MPEPDEDTTGVAGVVLTATATVTHPEGTALDEDGNPIPTEEQK